MSFRDISLTYIFKLWARLSSLVFGRRLFFKCIF